MHVTKFTHMRARKDVDRMLSEAAGSKPLILHTIVSEDLRSYLNARCRELGLPSRDLLGPLLESLERFLDA